MQIILCAAAVIVGLLCLSGLFSVHEQQRSITEMILCVSEDGVPRMSKDRFAGCRYPLPQNADWTTNEYTDSGWANITMTDNVFYCSAEEHERRQAGGKCAAP